ncbi:hypothetical protein ETB97_005567 [Aspergillus alliaceus]|uniref:Uncharacterized protein n=1 Tax=Petromyces alliaceus TaxID=209559 RepID=A0A8H6AD71_PETAA|nr:hypothetical protein ETB97_005567 [Aspergillus burnettii]
MPNKLTGKPKVNCILIRALAPGKSPHRDVGYMELFALRNYGNEKDEVDELEPVGLERELLKLASRDQIGASKLETLLRDFHQDRLGEHSRIL